MSAHLSKYCQNDQPFGAQTTKDVTAFLGVVLDSLPVYASNRTSSIQKVIVPPDASKLLQAQPSPTVI